MFTLLKYSTLFSSTFFVVSTLVILQKTKEFSYSGSTVSRSIHLLSSKKKALFLFNFIFKGLLDALFAWYIVVTWHLSYFSFLSLVLFGLAILFSLLAYFTEERGSWAHGIVIYSWIAVLLMAEFLISQHIGIGWLYQLTTGIVFLEAILSYGSLLLNKTNTVVQLVCFILLYVWMIGIIGFI